jgi:hypothetical protein
MLHKTNTTTTMEQDAPVPNVPMATRELAAPRSRRVASPDVIEAGAEYYRMGYAIVAVRANKHPWGNLKDGKNWRRRFSLEEIEERLKKNCPAIGFLGGDLNNNIVPLDFDTEAGQAWWSLRCKAAGIDPDDFPTVITPGKCKPNGSRQRGLHRYVTDVRGTLGNAEGMHLRKLGINIRGKGHAMLPPSPHPDGGRYEWVLRHSLFDFSGRIPPCPDFVYEALGKPAHRATPDGEPRRSTPRTRDRTYRYCRAALEGARREVAVAERGSRNQSLNDSALSLGRLAHHAAFTEEEVRTALHAACKKNRLITEDGLSSFTATFLSGWTRGIAEPKKIPDRGKRVAPGEAAVTDAMLRGDDGTDLAVQEVNKEFAYVVAGGKSCIMRETATHDGWITFELVAMEAFQHWMDGRTISHNSRPIALARYWRRHPQRRKYWGIVFEPGNNVPGSYNLWRGFAVEPKEGDCKLFLNHLWDNLCDRNEELYRWVVGWFAHLFQHPGAKTGTSLVIRGKMGTGKTKVGEVIGLLLGPHYVRVAEPRYITGRFNSHLIGCLLLHAEESFWAGDHAAKGKLKDLITSDRQFIEYKGKEPICVNNFVRLLVTGNSTWVVPAGMEERRFAVVDIGEEHREDHAYFAAIDHQMNNGGREALLHYLLHCDISSIDLRTVPKTAALLEQKFASLTPEQGWWLDTLRSARLPPGCEAANMTPVELLFNTYIEHAKNIGTSRRSIETRLGVFLNKMVPGLLKSTLTFRNRDDRKQQGAVYRFPPLRECRAKFEDLIGQQINWGDTEDWLR